MEARGTCEYPQGYGIVEGGGRDRPALAPRGRPYDVTFIAFESDNEVKIEDLNVKVTK